MIMTMTLTITSTMSIIITIRVTREGVSPTTGLFLPGRPSRPELGAPQTAAGFGGVPNSGPREVPRAKGCF